MSLSRAHRGWLLALYRVRTVVLFINSLLPGNGTMVVLHSALGDARTVLSNGMCMRLRRDLITLKSVQRPSQSPRALPAASGLAPPLALPAGSTGARRHIWSHQPPTLRVPYAAHAEVVQFRLCLSLSTVISCHLSHYRALDFGHSASPRSQSGVPTLDKLDEQLAACGVTSNHT